MSETAYIDYLLKAEQEAAEIIYNAQKYRQRKLKYARYAAEAYISKYRREKYVEFYKMKERKYDKEFETVLENETRDEINKIQQDYNQNKQKVVDMLVEKVLEVDLTIPNSVKEKFVKKK